MAKKRFSFSFIKRIFLIAFSLVVVPLLIFIGVIWDQEWRLKVNSVFTQFELMAESALSQYNLWIRFGFYQLEEFSKEEDKTISTKFIFNQDLICIFSTSKEMENKGEFFPQMLKKAAQNGELLFTAENPFTHQKEIFVLKKVGDQIRGLSVNLGKWLDHFTPHPHFKFSLVTLTATTKDFNLAELKKWKENSGFFDLHSLRGRDLALLVKLPQADFDLQILLPREAIGRIEGGKYGEYLLIFIGLIFVVGGGLTWWIIGKMTRPFYQLSEVLHAVGEKDYSQHYHPTSFGFEINTLGEQFNQTLHALLGHMEMAKNEKVAKEVLAQELQIGRNLQEELLPKHIPQFSGLEIGRGFVPAKEVAGDFYDLFAIDQDHLLMVIGDGSGKGIGACLYSLIIRSLFRSQALTTRDLARLISQVNELFCLDTQESGNFVTAWVGIYHVKDKRLVYTSAGHPPAILVHPNHEIEELSTEGIALGAVKIEEVETKEKILEPESLLLLYTDGVIEAHNEKGELFSKARLYRFIQDHQVLSPQRIVDQLLKEVNLFASVPQQDDLTLLSFKIF